MKLCPKCKAELTDNDMFCFVCGHRFEQQTLSQQPSVEGSSVLKPCPNCQAMPTSADDVFCAECGFRLIHDAPKPAPEISQPPVVESVQSPVVEEVQPPVAEPEVIVPEAVVQEPVDEVQKAEETVPAEKPAEPTPEIQPEPPVVVQIVPPAEQSQTPPASVPVPPPVQPQAIATTIQPQNLQASQAPKKKKSAGKVIFTIILILLIIIVVGGGVGSFLIYNGNVSREAVGKFVPKGILDMIPSAKGSISTTATRFFVVYCFGQFEKQDMKKGSKPQTEKQAVISDIFTNIDAGSETNDKAEVVFRSAGNEQIQKFTRFSKFFVTSFSTNLEAMTERENIIKDLKSKGYKPEFVRVVK